jgi:hypothetical protein
MAISTQPPTDSGAPLQWTDFDGTPDQPIGLLQSTLREHDRIAGTSS